VPEGDTLFVWARQIDGALANKPLVRATSNRVNLQRFEGRHVTSARAHGKQLLVEFDDGNVLRTHLRMHGRIRVRDGGYTGAPIDPHVRWLLATADKTAVCLDAPTVELLHKKELATHPVLSRLGPDVLATDLELDEILRRLRAQTSTPIGSALMDQEILAGIGNVYKSETLFIAEVSPFIRVAEIDEVKLTELVQIARRLMRRNLGPSRRTTPAGRVASTYWVYGRSGEPCLRCGARVTMRRQEPLARSTYYCPECQLPAELAPRA
jgi:endonuclease VIII